MHGCLLHQHLLLVPFLPQTVFLHLSCPILQIIKFTSACERKRGILPGFPPPFMHSGSTHGFVLMEWKRAEFTFSYEARVCLCKCLVSVQLLWLKTLWVGAAVGRKECTWLTLPGHSPSLKYIRRGTKGPKETLDADSHHLCMDSCSASFVT